MNESPFFCVCGMEGIHDILNKNTMESESTEVEESKKAEERLLIVEQEFHGHKNIIFDILCFPKQRRVVSCGRDGIRVWNVDTGECLYAGRSQNIVFWKLLKWDDESFLSSSKDGKIRLYSSSTFTEIRDVCNLAGNSITSIEKLSPDSILAVNHWEDNVFSVGFYTGKIIKEFKLRNVFTGSRHVRSKNFPTCFYLNCSGSRIIMIDYGKGDGEVVFEFDRKIDTEKVYSGSCAFVWKNRNDEEIVISSWSDRQVSFHKVLSLAPTKKQLYPFVLVDFHNVNPSLFFNLTGQFTVLRDQYLAITFGTRIDSKRYNSFALYDLHSHSLIRKELIGGKFDGFHEKMISGIEMFDENTVVTCSNDKTAKLVRIFVLPKISKMAQMDLEERLEFLKNELISEEEESENGYLQGLKFRICVFGLTLNVCKSMIQ